MSVLIPGCTDEQCKKFEQYLSLLLKWNKIHNLTAIRDVDEVVNRHFLEAIALLPHLGNPKTLVDLGTGPGFPGLPLAIMRPHCHITLIDSAHKKITFCQEVIRTCGLTNATALVGRAEDSAVIRKVGRCDAVISRATWALADYLPIALLYVQLVNGEIFAMKGPRYPEELDQLPPLPTSCQGPEVLPLSTEGLLDKNLVLIKFRTN